jgi:hypothetical protein
MTAPTLKKLLGEAGAGMDQSHGAPSVLREVLTAMAKAGTPLNAAQVGAVSTGVKAAVVAPFDGVIGDIAARLGTCGTAGSTTVVVNKNGTPLATGVAVAHDVADGEAQLADLSGDAAAEFSAGDYIEVEVTAVATGAADLDVSLSLRSVKVE